MSTRFRDVELHAPRGSELTCKGWQQEAALLAAVISLRNGRVEP